MRLSLDMRGFAKYGITCWFITFMAIQLPTIVKPANGLLPTSSIRMNRVTTLGDRLRSRGRNLSSRIFHRQSPRNQITPRSIIERRNKGGEYYGPVAVNFRPNLSPPDAHQTYVRLPQAHQWQYTHSRDQWGQPETQYIPEPNEVPRSEPAEYYYPDSNPEFTTNRRARLTVGDNYMRDNENDGYDQNESLELAQSYEPRSNIDYPEYKQTAEPNWEREVMNPENRQPKLSRTPSGTNMPRKMRPQVFIPSAQSNMIKLDRSFPPQEVDMAENSLERTETRPASKNRRNKEGIVRIHPIDREQRPPNDAFVLEDEFQPSPEESHSNQQAIDIVDTDSDDTNTEIRELGQINIPDQTEIDAFDALQHSTAETEAMEAGEAIENSPSEEASSPTPHWQNSANVFTPTINQSRSEDPSEDHSVRDLDAVELDIEKGGQDLEIPIIPYATVPEELLLPKMFAHVEEPRNISASIIVQTLPAAPLKHTETQESLPQGEISLISTELGNGTTDSINSANGTEQENSFENQSTVIVPHDSKEAAPQDSDLSVVKSLKRRRNKRKMVKNKRKVKRAKLNQVLDSVESNGNITETLKPSEPGIVKIELQKTTYLDNVVSIDERSNGNLNSSEVSSKEPVPAKKKRQRRKTKSKKSPLASNGRIGNNHTNSSETDIAGLPQADIL